MERTRTRKWQTLLSLEEMQRLNFPLHRYQLPHYYSYYVYDNKQYVGSIMLFRRRGASPISKETLETVESLEPFFLFAFTSLKARYFFHHTGAAMFNWSMLAFSSELKLTDREFEVLILRFYGLPFRKIAERLYLSHATVRKHAQALLRKGKARNAIELFTRRFLPELEEVVAGWKHGSPFKEAKDRFAADSRRDGRGVGAIYHW